MQDRDDARKGMTTRDREASPPRLEPGRTYLDVNHPERGPFVATGDEVVEADSNYVAEDDTDVETWRQLTAQGLSGGTGGRGHFAHDQGAFGTSNDPDSDVLNAQPPGVGENFTPKGGEEED